MRDRPDCPDLGLPSASDPARACEDASEVDAMDARFAARVAGPLRRAERLADDFESRLSAAVKISAPPVRGVPRPLTPVVPAHPIRPGGSDGTPSWWRRSHNVRASQLVGLAMAAGFAGLVSLATLRLADRADVGLKASTQASVAAVDAAADTIHVVRFVLVEPGARRVALVGDFNGWSADATPLVVDGREGTWEVSVPLPPGRHQYAFVVDGVRWVADPAAPTTMDDFDTPSSVVRVEAHRAPELTARGRPADT